MTDMNPKEAFFRFVKNHDLFADLEFLDEPVEDQEIIAVVGESFTADDGVVIDPDYDQIIESFMNINYDRWAVNYIYKITEYAKTRPEKEAELFAQALTELIIKPFINSNIDAEKIYFVIGDAVNWKDLSWAHKVIEA